MLQRMNRGEFQPLLVCKLSTEPTDQNSPQLFKFCGLQGEHQRVRTLTSCSQLHDTFLHNMRQERQQECDHWGTYRNWISTPYLHSRVQMNISSQGSSMIAKLHRLIKIDSSKQTYLQVRDPRRGRSMFCLDIHGETTYVHWLINLSGREEQWTFIYQRIVHFILGTWRIRYDISSSSVRMHSTWFLHRVGNLTVAVIESILKCMQAIGGGEYKYNAPPAPPNQDMRADTNNTIEKSSSRLLTVASPPDVRSDIPNKLLRR